MRESNYTTTVLIISITVLALSMVVAYIYPVKPIEVNNTAIEAKVEEVNRLIEEAKVREAESARLVAKADSLDAIIKGQKKAIHKLYEKINKTRATIISFSEFQIDSVYSMYRDSTRR